MNSVVALIKEYNVCTVTAKYMVTQSSIYLVFLMFEYIFYFY